MAMRNPIMSDEEQKSCDHDGCGCRVALNQAFCSVSCQMASESQMVGGVCECGRAACQQRQ